MRLKFRVNPQKLVESIVWIAQRMPGSSRYTVLKTLFYADKYHLESFGRPVTGDTYIKMAAGPVASLAYDLVKRSEYLPTDLLEAADAAFVNDGPGKYPTVKALRAPNMEWFSGTDIDCLERAVTYCADKKFSELKDATHQERAWQEASMNGEMDFALFIGEDVPDREELLEYIRETASCQMV